MNDGPLKTSADGESVVLNNQMTPTCLLDLYAAVSLVVCKKITRRDKYYKSVSGRS